MSAAPQLPDPHHELRAVVVVPARNEEALIGACIASLVAQDGLTPDEWEIVLVLSACSDETEKRARSTAGPSGESALHTVHVSTEGAGIARAVGMDLACRRLESVGRSDGLIATTDADSRVAEDWLIRQLTAVAQGAEAIGGRISLDEREAAGLTAATLRRRDLDHGSRLIAARAEGPADHPHFAGASIGITAAAYAAAGGMEPLAFLEDEALARRLGERGIEIQRLDSVRVVTSARTQGRAQRGLARDLQLGEWLGRRTYDGSDFDRASLLRAKREPVSLILPARGVEKTIAGTLTEVEPLRESGLLDEILVVNSPTGDRTGEIAAAHGATVFDESDLLPQFGPCRGKGDAMWRAASVAVGELLVFADCDSSDFGARFVTGALGPLLADPSVELVKGAFERPLRVGGETLPAEGGRVTELVARPLLNLHFPALAGLAQPLAGETAVRRELFQRLDVPVGYGVEIAMLIDAMRLVGVEAIAQAWLGTRQNRHQPLRALSAMAYEVMLAAERRIPARAPIPGALVVPAGAGGEVDRLSPRCEERPPLAALSSGAAQPTLAEARAL